MVKLDYDAAAAYTGGIITPATILESEEDPRVDLEGEVRVIGVAAAGHVGRSIDSGP